MNLDVLTDRFFDGKSLFVEAATVRVRDGVIERIDRGVTARVCVSRRTFELGKIDHEPRRDFGQRRAGARAARFD